jgi:flagellar FliJ protein
MKRFKFRLEKILQFRETIKADRLRELQIATGRLNEAQEHLEFLKQEFIKGQIAENEILLVSEVYIRSSYCERLKREVQLQIEEISRRQQEVQTARDAYVEASREFETLDRLKGQRHREYMVEVAKEEEKFLDELVTQKAARVINGID